MPEIPEFTAQPVAIPEARRSFVAPAELAEPGRALERTGAQVEQLGDAIGRIKAYQDYQYAADQGAQATVAAHDRLQSGIDEARRTGAYDGFAASQSEQLAADLQQRLDNAPSSAARTRLQEHFATLHDEVTQRAGLF